METDRFQLRDFCIEMTICYFCFEEIENKLIQLMKDAVINQKDSTKVAYFIHYSNIIFDRHEKLNQLKQNYTSSYPDELRRNIIQLNYPKLKKDYYHQFERALSRRDFPHLISLLNDYLTIYIDSIFALNKQFNPVEKRVLQVMDENCPIVPKMLKENIELLFVYASRCDKQLLQVLSIMMNQLDYLLKKEELV